VLLQLCFELYDVDKSGTISRVELTTVFRSMNISAAHGVSEKVDFKKMSFTWEVS